MRLRTACLAALLLVSFAPAEAADTAKLPGGTHPLSPDLAKRMDELIQKTEEYRGLRFKKAVAHGALTERELKARIDGEAESELKPARAHALDASLKAFGLLPEEASAARIYRDLLGEQIAAFYDPKGKYLAMVERKDKGESQELAKVLGAEMAERMQQGILVHELTHALDDQNFGLKIEGRDFEDAGAALAGLREGDATLIMMDFVMGQRVATVPGMAAGMADFLSDPGKIAAFSRDLPGGAGLAKAPAWFRDSLLFSYFQGLTFCLAVEQVGGRKLLNYAFEKDPPRSTEQILHPEKWHGRRDDPISLGWPDLRGALPGWQQAAEGQMGEEGILILLRERLPDRNAAAQAAEGWGGDRFAVYERQGKRLLVWLTEWDSAADAAEFTDAAARLGEGWRIVRSSPTRVVVLRGPLAAETGAAVEAALAAVPAERPANHDLDLAALGAAPEEPAAGAPAILHKLPVGEVSADGRMFVDKDTGFSIHRPAGEGWTFQTTPEGSTAMEIHGPEGSTVNVGIFPLERPTRLEEIAQEMQKNLQAAGEGSRDLGSGFAGQGETRYFELRRETEAKEDEPATRSVTRVYLHGENLIVLISAAASERWTQVEPAVRESLDSFALLPPPAPLGADGQTYTDSARGFRLRLPGRDWQVKRHIGQLDVLAADSPDGALHVGVIGQRMDFTGPLELFGSGLVAGMKQSGRKEGAVTEVLRSGVVEKEGRRWYEAEWERKDKAASRHGVTRLQLRGNEVFAITVTGTGEGWKTEEPRARSILEGFSLP